MSVRVSDAGVVELYGRCGVEDAEALQRHLLAAPAATVEWSGCERLHASVLQILLVGGPRVEGQPTAEFLRKHVAPIIGRSTKQPGLHATDARDDGFAPRTNR
jgi:hypothetical protein